MTNLWKKERRQAFNYLLKQYLQEGYDIKEAKSLAKKEVDEIMADKEDFVDNLWKETYRDV
jgi:hypothetical protein|tara:strand:- start:619 stop:801 length:183 start_codon:yes stop_codon:yes gene_type:complete